METTTQTHQALTSPDSTGNLYTTTPEGYVVDENGEVVGHVAVKEEFHISDRESAEWVLEKIGEAQGQVLALESRKGAILKNIDRQVRQMARRANFFLGRFGKEIEEFARGQLQGQKSRSLYFVHGTVSFRSSPGGLRVRDEERAIEWAEQFCPEAIKVKKSFQISALDADQKTKLIEAISRRDDGTSTRESAEEAEISAQALLAFEVKEPSESVTITTGIPTKLEG